MSDKVITIWCHEDGSMSVLQRGKAPPAPGSVFEVVGLRRRRDAEAAVRLALAPEPDRKTDGARWLEWTALQEDGVVTVRDVWVRDEKGALARVEVAE